MTREEARRINAEFSAMVRDFCAKHNLESEGTRLTYNDATLTWKVETHALDGSGERKIDPVMEAKAKRFLLRQGTKVDRIPEKIIGETFRVMNLGECKIVGFNSRSPKYAFEVETASGKVYRTTAGSIYF